MAQYASLWTSTEDNEFRQMSSFHSLQRRLLGLQMTGLQREHVRHVKRVRVQIREAGTLVSQYEDEKERRARHLLRTFSKVQRKRRAAEDWRSAHRRRESMRPEEASTPTPPSPTFDVEIGDKEAPWGGRKARLSPSRRRSSIMSGSLTSSRRSSVFSQAHPRQSSTPFGSFGKLPPIGAAGFLQPPPPPVPSSSSVSGSKVVSGFLKTWRGRRLSVDSDNKSQTTEESEEVSRFKTRRDAMRPTDKPRKTAAEEALKPLSRAKRDIVWTKTFPYVTHSAGADMCPRYSHLFLQYDEYKVQPARRRQKVGRTRAASIGSTVSSRAPGSAVSTTPSFKTVSKAVGAAQFLASRTSTMSLTHSH